MKSKVEKVTPVDDDHQVVTVVSSGEGKSRYRREPCPDCPWRRDAVGVFPADAFKVSAKTAYDMADSTFGCHSSGSSKSATCAGFLLKGADHNMSVRLSLIQGRLDLSKVSDGGHELFESYREMAEANGVSPDDPVLAPCRSWRE
ncbi:DUF6283 family protein [Marinobacter sp.]|uniref:DUF6283 family protein n=1 Tax=Marinobacter sp. TaxID=50741 RepID=UPI003A8DF9FC